MEPPRHSQPLCTTFPYLPQEYPAGFPYEYVIDDALEDFRGAVPVSQNPKVLDYDGMVPIPKESPFFGLPWLVFKTTHNLGIPDRVGIFFDEFKQCEETYRLIVEGKTSIRVLDNLFEPDFKAKIHHCIRLAFIRPTTRTLLLNLASLVDATISIIAGDAGSCNYTYSEKDVEVRITTYPFYVFSRRRIEDHPMPTLCHTFIELTHELCHAEGMLRFPRYFEWLRLQRPLHRIDTDCREEEEVIFKENQIRAEFRSDFDLECRLGHGGFSSTTQVPANRPSFYTNCFSGALDLIQDTIEKGLDPNCTFESQEGDTTPLLLAARQGHFAVVDFLLESMTDPFLASSTGETFPHALIRAGDLSRLKKYVESGHVFIPMADQEAVPLLHTALIELREQAWPFILYLTEQGADPHRLCPEGKNILHHAAALSDPAFFNHFAAFGINQHAVSFQGETPLHFALLNGNLPRVKELLHPIHTLRLFTTNGDSLLTYAFASFSEETVAWVLQMEQERARLIPGETLLPLSQTFNYLGESPLHLAIEKYSVPRHRCLIGQWITSGIFLAPVNSPQKPKEVQRLYSMFALAESPHWEMVLGMLSFQNKTWVEESWCRGSTLLNFAAAKGHLSLLNFVISLGATLNRIDVPHPLHVAVENNQLKVIELLLLKGSNPHQKYKGKTAVEYALTLQSDKRPIDPLIVSLLVSIPRVPYWQMPQQYYPLPERLVTPQQLHPLSHPLLTPQHHNPLAHPLPSSCDPA